MFKFFGGNSICKSMEKQLAQQSPDQAMWGQIANYLVRGKKPGNAKAQACLRAYLDLREALGPLANFRNGAQLTAQALDKPIRDFFRTARQIPADGQRAAWARFCLAADHLLAKAHEADFVDGKSRAAQREAMQELFEQTCRVFLDCRQPHSMAAERQEMEGLDMAAREALAA